MGRTNSSSIATQATGVSTAAFLCAFRVVLDHIKRRLMCSLTYFCLKTFDFPGTSFSDSRIFAVL